MRGTKWLACLLAVLLLALCGCGAQENFETEQLSVWIWDEDQLETWNTLAQSWGEEHHISVTVQAKDPDSYWQELQAGTAPDIFWVDTQHAQACISAGLLHSLDQYLEQNRSLRLNDFHSQLLPPFQSGELTYALPKDSSVTALWYNKKLFDAQKLAYPDETWTWEDLYDAAQQLTNRHNGLYGLAMGEGNTTDGWYNLVYAYGGTIVTQDKDGNRLSGWGDVGTTQAMDLVERLIRDCMPSQTIMAQLPVSQLFAGGHVAMVLQSSGDALDLAQESGIGDWGCALLPYCDLNGNDSCDEGERVSLVTGTAWAISALSTDGAAAYDLLTVLAGEEGQKAQSAANLAQPAMTGLGEDWGISLPDGNFAPYRTTLAEGTLVQAPVQLAGESWLEYAMSDTMYTAWNNPEQMSMMLERQQQYTASDLTNSSIQEQEPTPETAADGAPSTEPDGEAVQETEPQETEPQGESSSEDGQE